MFGTTVCTACFNQTIRIQVLKVFKAIWMRESAYKTLGSDMIISPLSYPSLPKSSLFLPTCINNLDKKIEKERELERK